MNLILILNILIISLSNFVRTEPSSVIEIIKFNTNDSDKAATSQNFKSSDQNGMGQIVNLIFNFLSSQALNSESDSSEKSAQMQINNDLAMTSECTCCDNLNETLTCKSCLASCSCECKAKYPVITDNLDLPKANYDVSLNAYTLILSIGMPCLSIVMIICTLISLTYCCKSRLGNRRNLNAQQNSENPLANPNISFVYVDFDANNQATKKEEPPNYNEIFSSSTQVDKLPTYNSFREKNAKKQNEQDGKF